MNLAFTAVTDSGRLDAFMAQVLPEHSRSFWQKMCTQGRLLVNDKIAKPSQKISTGDSITANLPQLPDFSSQDIPVLYQDDDIIVLNKPAGILTHAKGPQSDEFTVAEFMRHRTSDGADTNRPGIVHRLDRGTSGLIVAAKHSVAKRWLQKQFATRNVKKTYLALVHGRPKQPSAILRLPIERNPKKPQTFRVGSNGKQADTAYETVQSYKNYTLLRLSPRTGRTHQLRVHMHYLGCPIVGDSLYGKPDSTLGRMFLHAASLELTLPSRERKLFTAPLPPELEHFLRTLQT